jgi:hypothetical protein
MGRFGRKDRYRDGNRSSIGDEHVTRACSKLDQAFLKEIAANTPELSVEYLTRFLFKDEIIALIKQAHPHLYSASTHAAYTIANSPSVQLTFTFKDHPAPNADSVVVQPERGEDYYKTVAFIHECRKKWGLVKYVLRWMNQNATPGAIRALWPSALHLCDTSPAFHDLKHAPVRYAPPDGVGALLPLLRETATTVAFMGMMPDTMEPRSRRGVYMTLSQTGFKHPETGMMINLDYTTVGL